MTVKVKICGLTRPGDARTAEQAGASYLGVVFAGGARRISPQAAADIRAATSAVPLFGVYGDQTVEEILSTSEIAGLEGAQLHGSYDTIAAEQLRRAGLIVWRVVRIANREDLAAIDDSMAASHAVLVEPRVPGRAGGAGVALDLALARAARARLGAHPMALAGGLQWSTVREAATLVRPEVVDVSSGLECLPGIKDPTKIARFMEAVCAHSAIS